MLIDHCCLTADRPRAECFALGNQTFAVPNHLLIAGINDNIVPFLVATAQRRGWFVRVCKPVEDITNWIRLVPAGGLLLLGTGVISGHRGIQRLAAICDLPALPRTCLVAPELDVNALAVREICTFAGLAIQDILVHPVPPECLDAILGA